jgi:transposase
VRRGEQPQWIVPDGLWQRIEPLLPKPVRNPRHPGRKRIPDRQVLCGILFVLHTGIQWEFLPQELGFGSGMTCWRRLEEWNRAGVWQRLHELLLAELQGAGRLHWSRAVIDSSHVRAARRGPKSGPSPVDRARPGSKHHALTEGAGIPLAVSLTGGNRNDVTELLPLVDQIPPVRGPARPTTPQTRPALRRPGLRPTTSTARPSAPRASAHASPAAAKLTVRVSACTGGWLSAPSPGTTA